MGWWIMSSCGSTKGFAGIIHGDFDLNPQGCDASVLLDSTPGNPAEKDSPTNNPSLKGFDVIDEAKSTLESQCPQVVSCADIIALATRESVRIAGGFYYPVPAGRRDGLVSKESEANQNLPMAFFNVKQLEDNFARKGFSLEDMVTLSGAHTIGDSHCSAFSNRLYNFKNTTNASDPTMDQMYVSDLKSKCPAPGSGQNPIVSLDPVTPRTCKRKWKRRKTLDNQYYVNVKSHRGLLSSDQALMDREDTARMVLANINSGSMWLHKFADAMVRMGKIEVLTGSQGQVRKSCRVVN
ncbi:Peroxidase [Nymphaea thermarum]|nr:Peroxidase [Nymphaea thermarum]